MHQAGCSVAANTIQHAQGRSGHASHVGWQLGRLLAVCCATKQEGEGACYTVCRPGGFGRVCLLTSVGRYSAGGL